MLNTVQPLHHLLLHWGPKYFYNKASKNPEWALGPDSVQIPSGGRVFSGCAVLRKPVRVAVFSPVANTSVTALFYPRTPRRLCACRYAEAALSLMGDSWGVPPWARAQLTFSCFL